MVAYSRIIILVIITAASHRLAQACFGGRVQRHVLITVANAAVREDRLYKCPVYDVRLDDQVMLRR